MVDGPLEDLTKQDRLPDRRRIAGRCDEVAGGDLTAVDALCGRLGRTLIGRPLEPRVEMSQLVLECVLHVPRHRRGLDIERADVPFAN